MMMNCFRFHPTENEWISHTLVWSDSNMMKLLASWYYVESTWWREREFPRSINIAIWEANFDVAVWICLMMATSSLECEASLSLPFTTSCKAEMNHCNNAFKVDTTDWVTDCLCLSLDFAITARSSWWFMKKARERDDRISFITGFKQQRI